MKKQFLTFTLTFLVTLLFLNLSAQNNRPLGLIFDDNAYNEVPHLPRYEGKKYNNTPTKVSLRDYCPVPGDQGMLGSCVGWAAAYGGFSISKAIQKDVKNRKEVTNWAHSASYIYNQIKVSKDNCQSGARITDALWMMLADGVCTASAFPNSGIDCTAMPDDKAKIEANSFKIKDFAAIFSYDDEREVKFDKTIKALAAKNPVIIGMETTTSFWEIEDGQKNWKPAAGESFIGGHAMVVVGYDYIRREFEIMNSYGPAWGDEGFIWVSFEDFKKYVKYGFQIVIEDDIPFSPVVEEPIVVEEPANDDDDKDEEIVEEIKYLDMNGEFVFRFPTGYELDTTGNEYVAFEEAKAAFNKENGVYELVRKDWKVGDVFQLIAKNVPKGKNVYVFSVDAANKMESHWPFVDETDAFTRSALIPSEDAEIVIPNAEEGLRLTKKGEDNLCVLYSDYRIEDYQARMDNVKSSTAATFSERLEAGFGDLFVEAEEIKYELDQMSFNSHTEKKEGSKSVVPIILSVVAN